MPIAWTVAPAGLTVTASGIKASTPTVSASIAPSGGAFSSSLHGAFNGYLRLAPNAGTVGTSQDVSSDGTWVIGNLDYAQLYASQLVAVARAVPPAGITLLNPLEFVSPAFGLPVQAPLTVAATDGTRENDVQVVWPAVATGSAIRYRVFRDAASKLMDGIYDAVLAGKYAYAAQLAGALLLVIAGLSSLLNTRR